MKTYRAVLATLIVLTSALAGLAAEPQPGPTTAEKEVIDALAAKGCKMFLGRTKEFLCPTQAGYEACVTYFRAGRAEECRPGKGVDPNRGPRITVTPKADTGILPLSLKMTDRQERIVKLGRGEHTIVDYTFRITNASTIPSDWFAPLTVLEPESCWTTKTPSNARLFLEIAWGKEAANRRGDCRPLLSRADLNAVTFSLPIERGIPDLVQLIVRDRLTNLRHTTPAIAIANLGVSEILNQAGCFNLLGRSNDFACKTATALAACENLRKQGKPIQCRQSK